MRQKRAKTYRKLMHTYHLVFGFRQPYQVLVDSEFCKTALSLNTDVPKQLSVVLQGTVKLMITQCCIHELYLQGKSQQPAVDLAKSFERRKCNHREAIPGDECLASVVGDTNKHRYVIATQSQPLRARLRAVPGVPIVHINRSVMILEPPSDATLEVKQANEEQTLHAAEPELAKVASTSKLEPAPEGPPRKKRKGPKGPNPLSVKKKKAKIEGEGANAKATKPKTAHEERHVGEKRKHAEDGDHRDDVPSRETEGEGRKRKRRRKTAPTTQNTGEAAS
ncbi:PIN domain-like protein [Punctularia strigosozonata HHB-11173 SS5]|uniref:PIN domain-like protein n=1 Tax=Punctularia strigosozonata (strain HHB-11173) TaxID=741275 RepID=UPI0004418027|nr:PIN domain-like protein [Punctularia strigosozonata HHB-11173 SS5]EIN13520.1 PIN domain-like protein [Punctularia strigosozonata HHB-11173 SS5]